MITNEEIAAAIEGFKDGIQLVKLRRYADGPLWTAYKDGIALAEAFIRNRRSAHAACINANMPDWEKISP